MILNTKKERQSRIRTLPTETETAKIGGMHTFNAEEFASLSSLVPMLFLDKNANITDVSAKYKSCHGEIGDRTVLQDAVGDGYELLRTLCRSISEERNEDAHVFGIALHRYRYAVLYRMDVCSERVNVLCLAKSEAEISSFCSSYDAAGTASENGFESKSVLREEDDLSSYEAYLMARGISERMGRRMTFSHVSFNGYADDRSSSHVAGLCPDAFALALMSVIKLLDTVTDSRTITVSFYGGSAVRMEVSTDAGELFGVSEYSGYLHGLLPCISAGTVLLICTVLSAEKAGLAAEASVRDGKVNIVFSSEGAQYPAMDFKFDDISERIDTLCEKISVLLSMTADAISPQEGAEEV